MTATNEPINTDYRDGILIPVALAASTVVLMGTFAVVNAEGYGLASSAVGGLDQVCVGVWDADAENTGGNGEAVGLVRRNKQFLFANSAADPVTQAVLGTQIYIEDNQTVAKTDGAGTRSVAGRFMGFDENNNVWVEIH
ncbi:hypothetical protein F892_03109 [Acinetobacter vivianii]|uniref:Uncharacterized protein n=1 Tax=Acinetobacter vivianii TaxID=1776742 RepID=N9PR75_9GAMM|nr:hypothetical protein [Acinetobacter vivianii]ENX20186.1 hypothetical protein F892_03109 [Acinetobacter vivianii]GGI59366.1 hypothetical protein GCM10011446_08610 [Acinetobacter vivianii]